jgi:hypothetical protein
MRAPLEQSFLFFFFSKSNVQYLLIFSSHYLSSLLLVPSSSLVICSLILVHIYLWFYFSFVKTQECGVHMQSAILEFLLSIFCSTGVWIRASPFLGRCSTTWAISPALTEIFISRISIWVFLDFYIFIEFSFFLLN